MNVFSDISIWWLLPLSCAAFLLSGLYYFWKPTTSLSRNIRLVLFLLRGFGLAFIFLLLLGVLYQSHNYSTERPILLIYQDESASMLNYSDSSAVKEKMEEQIAALSSAVGSKFDVKNYSFSDQLSDTNNYRFEGTVTNLSLPFQHLRNGYINRNVGAVVLISDGNFNQGISPLYETEKLTHTPVYSIMVGDTITKRDAAIRTVRVNQIAFSGNIFPVHVEASASKLKGKTATIQVRMNNTILDEKRITIDSDLFEVSEKFQIEARGSGIQALETSIQVNENEYTLKNNVKTAYIEVLESKRKIAILVGGIHPDVGAMQSVLKKDLNTDVSLHFAKETNDIPKSDLILFFNPTSNLSLWNKIQESDVPYLVFTKSENDLRNLNLGVKNQVPSKKDNATVLLNKSLSLINFSAELEKRLNDFPPLFVPYKLELNNLGSAVLFQRIGNITTDRPILTIAEYSGRKHGVFFGEGIWRWKLNEFNKHQDNKGFDELWGKVLQYLTVKSNRDKLRVFSPENASDQNEVLFKAEFYNDAFQLTNEPTISFELRTLDDNPLASYEMQRNMADYQLNLGRLKAGAYKWLAKTSFNGKTYSKSGELIVGESTLEATNLTANFGLMYEIAQQTQGKLIPYDELSQLADLLNNRDDITSISYEHTDFKNLIDYTWYFLLIILFFTAEWTLRRWFGNY